MTEYVAMTDFEFEQLKIRRQLQKLSEEASESENGWDGDRTHFFLIYSFELAEIIVDFVWDECHGDIYFPTRESAKEAIQTIGAEALIKYWFGIPHVLVPEKGEQA